MPIVSPLKRSSLSQIFLSLIGVVSVLEKAPFLPRSVTESESLLFFSPTCPLLSLCARNQHEGWSSDENGKVQRSRIWSTRPTFAPIPEPHRAHSPAHANRASPYPRGFSLLPPPISLFLLQLGASQRQLCQQVLRSFRPLPRAGLFRIPGIPLSALSGTSRRAEVTLLRLRCSTTSARHQSLCSRALIYALPIVRYEPLARGAGSGPSNLEKRVLLDECRQTAESRGNEETTPPSPFARTRYYLAILSFTRFRNYRNDSGFAVSKHGLSTEQKETPHPDDGNSCGWKNFQGIKKFFLFISDIPAIDE